MWTVWLRSECKQRVQLSGNLRKETRGCRGDKRGLGKAGTQVLVAHEQSPPTEHAEASWETFCWFSFEVKTSSLWEHEVHGLDGRMCQTAPCHGSVLQYFAIGVYKPTFLSLTLAFCLVSSVTAYRICGRFYSTLYNDCYLSLGSKQRKSPFAPYTAVLIEESLNNNNNNNKRMALPTSSRETKRKTEIKQKKMNLWPRASCWKRTRQTTMHTSQRAQAVSHWGLIHTILLIFGIEATRISVLCLMYGCFKETCVATEENQLFRGNKTKTWCVIRNKGSEANSYIWNRIHFFNFKPLCIQAQIWDNAQINGVLDKTSSGKPVWALQADYAGTDIHLHSEKSLIEGSREEGVQQILVD